MAHSEHNRQKRSGGFFLIIFGALLFIITPLYLQDSPQLGLFAIILGFFVGGIGFYLQFVRGRKSRT